MLSCAEKDDVSQRHKHLAGTRILNGIILNLGTSTKFSENINIQVLRERFADEHADGVIGWFEFDSKVEDQQKLAKLVMASA